MDKKVSALLERAYREFHSHYYREKDPVSLAHRYPDAKDREVAAFFAACLAYGNVATILSSANRVLKALGASPHQTLLDGPLTDRFSGFKHRFTTADDIEILCHWLSGALRESGSLQAFFLKGSSETESMKTRLSSFVRRLTGQKVPKSLLARKTARERNLKYLISDPEMGSACKRLNMYLRWMVRHDDGVDLGLWDGLQARTLMLPIDTHILKAIRYLGWSKSKQATWRVVEESTEQLRRYCPEDPIRYDFALCHLSMAGKTLSNFE